MSNANITEENIVSGFHIPRWEELPDIDLYMDQVIAFVDRIPAAFSRPSACRC